MDRQLELDAPAFRLASRRSTADRLQSIFGRDWKIALIFVLPTVLIMAGLIFWPFVNAILLSTTSLNFLSGETANVGLRNYQRLFSNSDYLLSMQNTIRFTIWSLAIKFATGMAIALILNSRLPARALLSGIMLLPWIVPEIVTALAWKSIYDPIFGGLNPILLGTGIIDRPLGWLSDPHLAMPSVIAVNVWKGIPFYTLLLLAGLKAIDQELLQAAEVDGANVFQRFRHVTLPGLKYVIIVVLLLSFISTFNQFGLIFLMTGGGPSGATRLYSILAYEKAIGSLQYGPGSAIALSVAPLMAVIIWLLAKFMRHDENAARVSREPSFGDRLLKLSGRVFGALLDLVFLPFELMFRGLEAIGRVVRKRTTGFANEPLFKQAQRGQMAVTGRLLVLLPIMGFVLFPFYWVIVTSFKSTPQISERTSIFWPRPFTLDRNTSTSTTISTRFQSFLR